MGFGYYGMGYYFDPTIVLVLIGVVISMLASAGVQNTFRRYSSVRSMTGMSGAEAAERLLHTQGIYDVSVRHVSGNLTDHYDPRNKTLNLSDAVYQSTSVAGNRCGSSRMRSCDSASCGICSAPASECLCTDCQFRQPVVHASDSSRSDFWRCRQSDGTDWYLDVCTGTAVSGTDTSGGIQCFPPGSCTSGTEWNFTGAGSRTDQKSSGTAALTYVAAVRLPHYSFCVW